MEITVKLFATLRDFLPEDAKFHAFKVEVSADDSPQEVLDRFNVPRAMSHLVLLNGVYLSLTEREKALFRDGDTLSVWPPVAGG